MPKDGPVDIDRGAQLLKLLGDPTRLTILKLLQTHDCCVCEFVAIFKMSQPNISQHIRKLKDAGLLIERRCGQWIFYSLQPNPLVVTVLNQLPNQDFLMTDLEERGERISCT